MLIRDIIGAYSEKYKWIKKKIKREFRPSLILVNDWPTLPLACALKKRYSAKLIYDVHEWSREEHLRDIKKRISVIPACEKIENKFIHCADAVYTVNESIKFKIREFYGIESEIIRNCAFKADIKPEDKKFCHPVKFYYHGVYLPMRKIEIFAKAISHFPERFELYLRLVGKISKLKHFCSGMKNVYFVDPVQMKDLIIQSQDYDVGVAYIYPSNFNNLISLPNKFFEYIMAGLPVFSGPSPEMKKIIDEFNIGFVSEGFSVRSIVRTLDEISTEKVKKAYMNVFKAREKLNSDIEWEKIVKKADSLINE
ncbi:glycosyltransferase [candidate division WOR-3 bacterium]|nr:glycosyltransferase [candidate division WOR-3 bacterium]